MENITINAEERAARAKEYFNQGYNCAQSVALAYADSPCPSADDAEAKKANYALVQEFAEQFRQQNGSIVCRSLLGLDRPKDEPTPSPRTAEYYKKRPCSEYVYDAALIVGKYLAK